MKFLTTIIFLFIMTYIEAQSKIDTSNYTSLRSRIKDKSFFIKLDSNNFVAYADRASLKDKLGDYKGAIKDFDKAISIKNHPDIISDRGNTKKNLKEYDAAIIDYNEAIRLKPNFSNAHFERGKAFQALNKYNDAINDFTKVIELNSFDYEAFSLRAECYIGVRNWGKALDDFNKAITLDRNPKNGSNYHNRGLCKYNLNDFDGAFKDYDNAIKIESNNALYYFSRGGSYAKSKKYDLALLDYNTAIEFDSEFKEAIGSRGMMKIYLNDKEGGCEDLNNALKLGYQVVIPEIKEYCK